jgi:tRNA dimethylallyltransferase
VRAKWLEIGRTRGPQHLHAVLQKQDPDSAEKIHPHNFARLARALEILEVSGQRRSNFLPHDGQAVLPPDTPIFFLDPDLTELRRSIWERTMKMFANGLMEEAELLRQKGWDQFPSAATAIGYREAFLRLDGKLSRDEGVEQAARRTWQYARRQNTFFRNQFPHALRMKTEAVVTAFRQFLGNTETKGG